MHQFVVDPHLHARRFIAQEALYTTLRIEVLASLAQSLVVLINLRNRRIKTHARHIRHIAYLPELRLLVMHLANILKEGVALLDGADSLRVGLWQTIHTNPVVARTDSHHTDSHLTWLNGLLNKQTVYHLVKRTITTDNHNMTIAILYGLHSKFGDVMFMLRKDQLVGYLVLAYELGNQRQVLQTTRKTRNGINQHEPRLRYICLWIHSLGYFSGAFFNVCNRKS